MMLTTRSSGPWSIVGRVWPRHGHRGRPLNSVVDISMRIFLVILAAMACQLWLYYRIAKRLRERHPHAWVGLGSPDEFAGDVTENTQQYFAGIELMSFMWKGNVAALQDGHLTRLCYAFRVFSVLTIVAMLVFLVWAVVSYGFNA